MKFKKQIIELKQIANLASALAVQKKVSFEDGLTLDSISDLPELKEVQDEQEKLYKLFQKKNKEIIEKATAEFPDDETKREEFLKKSIPSDYESYTKKMQELALKEVEFEFEPIQIMNFKDVEENVREYVFNLKKLGFITK